MMAVTPRDAVFSRFADGESAGPVFLPDLRIWYDWHRRHNSLPEPWTGASIHDIYRDLSAPIWHVVRPWSLEADGAISHTSDSERRTESIAAGGRTLTAEWVRGPDGDWWQTQYLAKDLDDLKALLAFVESRRFVADLSVLQTAQDEVGDDGVVVVDLPARPFSWMMLEALGWSEGLMLFFDAREIVEQIIDAAEVQLQALVSELTGSARLFASPDNLDAQFISPSFFSDFLAQSYVTTSRMLASGGGHLIVHAGGPIGALLPAISAAEIGGITGICGPPQADTPLPAARELVGPGVVLMGGIAQDVLLPGEDESTLHQSIDDAIAASADNRRTIITIADHVPIGADVERLKTVANRFKS